MPNNNIPKTFGNLTIPELIRFAGDSNNPLARLVAKQVELLNESSSLFCNDACCNLIREIQTRLEPKMFEAIRTLKGDALVHYMGNVLPDVLAEIIEQAFNKTVSFEIRVNERVT